MAVSTLARLSEDKVTRQAYQRRQDDILLVNKKAKEFKMMKRRVEQAQRRAEQAQLGEEQAQRRAEQAEAVVANQAKLIAELKSKTGSK